MAERSILEMFGNIFSGKRGLPWVYHGFTMVYHGFTMGLPWVYHGVYHGSLGWLKGEFTGHLHWMIGW